MMNSQSRSLRVSIFLPLVLLLIIGSSAMFWISETARSSHKYAEAYQQQVTKALEVVVSTKASIAEFDEYISEVTSFDRIIPQEEISETFIALRGRVLNNLQELTTHVEMGVGPETLDELETSAIAWANDAEIVLGLRRSNKIPTLQNISVKKDHIQSMMSSVYDQARVFEERAMQDNRSRFREHMTAAQIGLVVLLIVGGFIAFYRANHLASALQRLSADMARIRKGQFNFEVGDATRKDEIGEMARNVASFSRDLEELTATKEHVEYLALHDPLTGLRNRRCMDRKLEEILRSDHPDQELIAMHIDLDRFKIANDTHGHHAGDEILKAIAKVLMREVSPTDLLFRVGGDEFLVLSWENATLEKASELAESIIRGASAPIAYKGADLQVNASIGVAFYSESERDPEILLSNADLALYDAKAAGRGLFKFSSKAQRIQRERQRATLEQLKQGLSQNELIVYFQPQIDVSSNSIVGMEALIRWDHPERGMLTPIHFLDLAMDSGLGDELTTLCIEQSIAALKTWRKLSIDVPRVSINLAANQLRNPDLIEELNQRVCDGGLSSADISIEIVESVLFGDHEDLAISQVKRLRDLGYQIELDDFGTGHASISNLTRFKVDRIKIDRMFVTDMDSHSDKHTIVAALIDLAKKLDIECLAEGLETTRERDELVSLGCTQFQGYLFSRPQPQQAMTEWLLHRNAREASLIKAV